MNRTQHPIIEEKLGVSYTPEKTTIKVWAPTAREIKLAVYDHPKALQRKIFTMQKAKNGIHAYTIEEDLNGFYYTFIVNGKDEITDPYSVATSANGTRSAIVDLSKTNPTGWDDDGFNTSIAPTDAIIYELHIKDYTFDKSSGAHHAGKYLGLAEEHTHFEGLATGLDHLVELGITHVHLMPIYDFLSVDELSESPDEYNWGYDPDHFNTPEGSYATDPENPTCRIIELKTLIKALHDKGLRVIMDVVYNHTYRSKHSNFNTLVPGYYYRMTPDGHFSNGSGCGNEFASENPMARKFIIDSLMYWASEYHIDGFRFDLMALIDLETIMMAKERLSALNPDIFIYGEPWMGGLSTLAENNRLFKGAQCGKGFALFNDEFRDAIKGDNDGYGHGFIQGNLDLKYRTQIGILGSIPFDDAYIGFAKEPSETINYINSHDNLILYDKLDKTNPSGKPEDLIRLNKLAFNIMMLSQGVPFIHEGNEFLRSKQGWHNSYNAPMAVNAIHWENKRDADTFYTYIKELIAFRKNYDAFRLPSADAIRERVKLYKHTEHIGRTTNAIAYSILGQPTDDYNCLFIIHNAQATELIISISEMIAQLCKSYQKHLDKASLEIKLIFDERGVLRKPEIIHHSEHHLLKVKHYSTTIYSFSVIT
jgi:pullulanase